jgi:hypothetical protein
LSRVLGGGRLNEEGGWLEPRGWRRLEEQGGWRLEEDGCLTM